MEYLIANWYIGVVAIALLVGLVIGAYKVSTTPSNKQLEKVKQWLLYAVISAEKELGSKTGKLKLSLVYGSFISKFKWMAMIISFETFSLLVDESLEEMRKMLEDNKAVVRLVEGNKE